MNTSTATTVRPPSATPIVTQSLGDLTISVSFSYADVLGICDVQVEAQSARAAAQIASSDYLYTAIIDLAALHLRKYASDYRAAALTEEG